MSCREEIRPWTFAALVGAFVDLAVAHLLLCAAAVAYLAERFLAFFGFDLPCRCLSAGDPACLRGILADAPVSRIASVRRSVWRRPPFDSIWAVDGFGCRADVQGLIRPPGGSTVGLLEGEESSGSVLLLRQSQRDVASDEPSSSTSVRGRGRLQEVGGVTVEEPCVKGGKRGTSASKPLRLRLRRRRREAERNNCSPNSGYAAPLLRWKQSSRSVSPCSDTEISDRDPSNANQTPIPSTSDIPPLGTNEEFSGSNSLRLVDTNLSDAALIWASSTKCEGVDTVALDDASDTKDAEMIRNLGLALKEAQASRSALYRELEKERSAAATAADEAMAMIERLQKEKASVEMNARQYQRMIEEKTTYDEEEMDILKEIVLRRERELYMLEKEVEMYREMTSAKYPFQPFHGNRHIPVHPQASASEDDPTFMLTHLSRSIKERDQVNHNGVAAQTLEPITAEKQIMIPSHFQQPSQGLFRLTPQPAETSGVNAKILASNDGFQEKDVVVYTSSQTLASPGLNVSCSNKLKMPEESGGFPENLLPALNENGANYNNTQLPLSSDRVSTGIQRGRENQTPHKFSHLETESSTLDVHVVDDQAAICQETLENGSTSQTDAASVNSQDFHTSEPYDFKNGDVSTDCSSTSCAGREMNLGRSRSDVSRVRRSLDGSLSRAASPMDPTTNSTSAVDTERSKLEYEIEDLTRRLKLVQQGREKLNFSVDRVEKEKFQLQLLEEIALHLKEIRQQTGLGSATRQSSLPPPSSKANSKKKRCRSASLGIQGSQ